MHTHTSAPGSGSRARWSARCAVGRVVLVPRCARATSRNSVHRRASPPITAADFAGVPFSLASRSASASRPPAAAPATARRPPPPPPP
eukprot:3347518-Prymnesium_polylepis.1